MGLLTVSRGINILGRQCLRCFQHFIYQPAEINQTRNRDDDASSSGTSVFRDSQKPATGIFFEREDKQFPLNAYFHALEGVFFDLRRNLPGRRVVRVLVVLRVVGTLILPVRSAKVGPGTFVGDHNLSETLGDCMVPFMLAL